VFSMTRHLDTKVASELASYYASVDSIEATSPTQVTVTLKEPDPLFQYVPAFVTGLVVEKKFWEEHEEDIGTPDVLTMGTGPFQITEYAPEESVTLVRNENYWGERPLVGEIAIQFIVDAETRLLAMRAEELDGAFEVPIQSINQWDRLEGNTISSVPGLQVEHFSFDVATAPWSDIHVRRAFAHALDKVGLVDALLHGRGTPARTLVPANAWPGLLSTEAVEELYAGLPQYEFDLEKAQAELAASSVPDGFQAAFKYPDAFPEMGKVALSLSENLKEIGVTLTVEEAPLAEWLAERRSHKNLGIGAGIWFMDYPDPANIEYIWLHSKFAVENGLNEANYKNAEVDRLLDEQQRSSDPAVRARALGEVLEIIAVDLPYLPIWFPEVAMSVDDEYVYRNFSPLYIYQPWATYVESRS
jgi:peptide/nickel transport system substrate-binding protein